MTKVVCSTNHLLRQYVLLFDDDVMSQFIENPILESCGIKTNCRIYLTNRWLNRAIRPGNWNRYFIINISGEDQFAIDRCIRLIEKNIPEFRIRQTYKPKSKVTLYTNEWIPDNSPVSQPTMRMGAQRSNFGTLGINSPYATNRGRKMDKTPWKITSSEKLGHYESGDIFRPIYSKSTLGPVDFINPNFPLRSDIDKFHLPNSFDRYATFRSIDGENIDKKLQEKCCRLINNITNGEDKPTAMTFELDARQSSIYHFGYGGGKYPPNTDKIHINDPRAATLHKLTFGDVMISNFTGTKKVLKVDATTSNKIDEQDNSNDKEENNNTQDSTNSIKIVVDPPPSIHEETSIRDSNRNSVLIDAESRPKSAIINEEENEVINDNQSNQQFANLLQSQNNKIQKSRKKLGKQKYTRRRTRHRWFFYSVKARLKRKRYHRLMKQYLKSNSYETTESKLTDITSPVLSDFDNFSRASKSSNIYDNTLDSMNSLEL